MLKMNPSHEGQLHSWKNVAVKLRVKMPTMPSYKVEIIKVLWDINCVYLWGKHFTSRGWLCQGLHETCLGPVWPSERHLGTTEMNPRDPEIHIPALPLVICDLGQMSNFL